MLKQLSIPGSSKSGTRTVRASRPTAVSAVTDSDLLDRFNRKRDEAAFELLVWRHGAMVFDTCRRVLPVAMDAEDAFQATFITLATKGATFDGRGSLAGWLYRVATRVSRKSKARGLERKRREGPAGVPDAQGRATAPDDDASRRELDSLIDSEIGDLPAKYRSVIVLCHLQGKTNREAATELGCPVGTVVSRLARAKARLRNRLRSRGVIAGALAVTLVESRAMGACTVPADLVFSAAKLASTAKTSGLNALPAMGPRALLGGGADPRLPARARLLLPLLLLLFLIAAAAWWSAGSARGAAKSPGHGVASQGQRGCKCGMKRIVAEVSAGMHFLP